MIDGDVGDLDTARRVAPYIASRSRRRQIAVREQGEVEFACQQSHRSGAVTRNAAEPDERTKQGVTKRSTMRPVPPASLTQPRAYNHWNPTASS